MHKDIPKKGGRILRLAERNGETVALGPRGSRSRVGLAMRLSLAFHQAFGDKSFAHSRTKGLRRALRCAIMMAVSDFDVLCRRLSPRSALPRHESDRRFSSLLL